jgi:hypothetical protein
MSRNKSAQKVLAGQRLTVLQAWVATTGCWTAAAIVWHDSALAAWLAFGAGCVLAYGSAMISRKLGRAGLNNLPILIGLLSATAATQINNSHGMVLVVAPPYEADAKGLITAILLCAFLIEQLAPSVVRRIRSFLQDIVREELGDTRAP